MVYFMGSPHDLLILIFLMELSLNMISRDDGIGLVILYDRVVVPFYP